MVWPRGGDPRIHAFTSLGRLQEAIGESKVPYVGLPANVLFAAVDPDVDIVLNEGVWYGKQIVPDERRLLMAGFAPGQPTQVPVTEGDEVFLEPPAEYPQQLVDALRQEFERTGEVVEARVAQLHIPSTDQPPHPVVGIRVKGGAVLDDVLRAIGPVVESAAPSGMAVDFVDLDGSGPGEYLRTEAEAFYPG